MNWLDQIRTMLSPRPKSRRNQPARSRRWRPRFERLEDRVTPAVGDLLQTITTPLRSSSDLTGWAVAGTDNLIVVGTPTGFLPGGPLVRGGAVHVYSTNGDALFSIGSPQARTGSQFGYAVAMAGNNILVGEPSTSNGGAAYLFDGSTGQLLQTFLNPTPVGGANDWFGAAVAAVGNNVVIGAPFDDAGATNAGAAYLFDGGTGQLLQTFLNPTPAVGESFGYSVAAVGDNVLIGAPFDNAKAKESGAAYLFDSSTGAILNTFLNPRPSVGDQFGKSLAVVGGDIVIGAPFEARTGAAYQYRGSTNTIRRYIWNPTPAADEQFGCSLAAVGNNLLIGSLWDKTPYVVGAAYLFDGNTGMLLHRFMNPTPKSDDQFGFAVAAAGRNILIGAPRDESTGNGLIDTGSVYLFDGVSYRIPDGNGPDDLLLQPGFSTWNLFDRNTNALLASGSMSSGVILVGSDEEDDRVTVDSRVYLSNQTLPISFDGGAGGTDALIVISQHMPSPTINSVLRYRPNAFVDGSGEVSAHITFGTGRLSLPIGFAGVESVEVSSARSVDLFAEMGAADFTIDAAIGEDGQPVNIVSGVHGTAQIAPMTFFDIASVGINTSAGNDRITVSDAGFVAQGLKHLTISTGNGDDELMIVADDYTVPDNPLGFIFDGGRGVDQLTVLTDSDLTLARILHAGRSGTPQLANSGGGSIVAPGVERFFLAGRAGNNRIDASRFVPVTVPAGAPPMVTLSGGDGDDTIIGTSKDDLILGGDGDDVIVTGNGVNTVDAGAGDDTVTGGTGRDFLTGGDGDDVLDGGLGDDVLDGGDGNNLLRGGDGNDRLTTLSGNDTLFGGTGNDSISAGDGQDALDGGTGNDTLVGGAGDDTILGGTGNDLLDGGSGDDYLDGGTGNNRLFGGIGNDTLLALAGADYLDGGDGDDSISAGAGNDTVRGGDGNDWIDAGDGQDEVYGDAGKDTVYGGTGDDSLFGGDGDDSLIGGSGFDYLDGGLGFDIGKEYEVAVDIEG